MNISRAEIAAKVREVVVDTLSILEYDYDEKGAFDLDFGADSLDIVDIVLKLEKHFELTIPDERWDSLETPAAVIDFLYEKLNCNEGNRKS